MGHPRGKDAALAWALITAAITRIDPRSQSPPLPLPLPPRFSPFLPYNHPLPLSLLHQVICSFNKHSWEFAVLLQTEKLVNEVVACQPGFGGYATAGSMSSCEPLALLEPCFLF